MAFVKFNSDIRKYDEKLKVLSDSQFRVWFNLLCLASENGGVVDMDEHLRLETHCTSEFLEETLSVLNELEVINISGGQIFMQYENVRLPHKVNQRDMKRRNTPIFQFSA